MKSATKMMLAILLATVTLRAQMVDNLPIGALFEPYGVAVDWQDNSVYISDGSNNQILRYDPKEGKTFVFEVFTGAPEISPQGVVITTRAGSRGLVVTDPGSHRVHFIRFSDQQRLVLAGSTRGRPNDPANGLEAQFAGPAGVAAAEDGTIYLADLLNNKIRRIANDSNSTVTTVANGVSFYRPAAVAVGPGDRLYVADSGNNSIKVIDLSTEQLISEVIGFDGPRGLVWVGGELGLLVADTANHVIRSVFNVYGRVVTYSGTVDVFGAANGSIGAALYQEPVGLALDRNGVILVADLKNHLIRQITRPAAPAPVLEPAGGNAFVNSVTISAQNALPGSVFRYTTDGKEPTILSDVLPSPYTITGGPVPLQVRAFHPDFTASLVTSNMYAFTVAPLTIVPQGGTFSNDVAVAISTPTLNAGIHFTTDQTSPTNSSQLWSNRVLSSNTVLLAQGFRNGFTPSPLISNVFNFFVNPLTVTVNGGTFINDTNIDVSSLTDGVRFYYTTNGTIPTEQSAEWNGPRGNINGRVVIRGFKSGYTPSVSWSNVFRFVTAEPILDPAGLASNNPVRVRVSSATEGARIYYAEAGADPIASGTLVTGGSFLVTSNGIVNVVALRDNYETSRVVAATFDLVTAPPVVEASTNSSDNDIVIKVSSLTSEARIYYGINQPVTNGSPSVASGGTIRINQDGIVNLVAIRDGFKPSAVVSQSYSLKAGAPKISPEGISTNNPVGVQLSSSTEGATLVWTIDGSIPRSNNRPNEVANGGTFTLATNGTLRVAAIKDGYKDSEVVSFNFQLKAAQPVVSLAPLGGTNANVTNINQVTVTLSSATEESTIFYRLDGRDPTPTDERYTAPFLVTTNAQLRAIAVRAGFLDSAVTEQNIYVRVDNPTMTPPSGFFQDGTLISFAVQRPEATIHYTFDDSDPNEQSAKFTGAPIKIDRVNFPSTDLRRVKIRAFAPNVLPSEIVSGTLADTNTIGIARDIKAGTGSKVVVPVVMGLKAGQEVRSLQYRVQVYPTSSNAPNLSPTALEALSVGTNDFVTVIGSLTTPTTNFVFSPAQSGDTIKTNELVITYLGTGANLLVKEFATINLIAVRLPATAPGHTYAIRVVEASATSDGNQQRVELKSGEARTITLINTPYTVGDTSPGGWYNSGDFGDGDLDNSDVNNVFAASLGIRSPFRFTDAFNAMDAFPLDEAEFDGGDGILRLLDWQVILNRSLRRDPVNWQRAWNPGGYLVPSSVELQRAPLRQSVARPGNKPALDWFKHGLLEATHLEHVEANRLVQVPVFVEVKAGVVLNAFQFRAVVETTGAALTQPVAFLPASGFPVGMIPPGLGPNEVAYAWSLDAELGLQGRVLLGQIQFQVPSQAQRGACYRVRFLHPDGAGDLTTPYDFESIHGCVYVGAAAEPNPFGRLSDEWRLRFFGALDNLQARLEADPDGDGKSNWQEYLEGSDPTQLRMHHLPEWKNALRDGFKIRWFARPGVRYIVETASTPSGPWSEFARVSGDGTIKERVDVNPGAGTRFYRITAEEGAQP